MISRIGKLVAETTGALRFSAAQALRDLDVVLIVDTGTDPFMACSALALTLRCFTGRTLVRAVSGRTVPPQVAEALTREAAEYGARDRLSLDGPGGTLALGLGCSAGDLFVDARGWSVSVNELAGGPVRPAHAPTAAFAAAAGVAKVFGTLIGRPNGALHENWTAPMLDFTPGRAFDDCRLELGRLVVIGAGAIGSAFAHVLRGSPWRAHLILLDYQRYDEPNHETTLLVARETTLRQAPKAVSLAACLRSSTITVQAMQERVAAGHQLLAEPVDAIVCAVDNPELRRQLDRTAARVVLNAGVGGTREDAGMVLWTRHRRDEVPLSTHYLPNSDAEEDAPPGPEDVAADECSRLSYASVSLAAPFMGLAAGALLAAGVVQEALQMHAPTNYLKIDLLGLQRWMTRRAA